MDEISQLLTLMGSLPGAGIRLAGGIINDHIQPVSMEEFEQVSSAGTKRQREFLCGRYYAHQLIDSYGYSGFAIGRDDMGYPVWPDGITGSISHTNVYCVVAVTDDTSVRSIGIDLEESGRMKQELWRRLFTDEEINSLRNISDPVEQMRQAAIMFSAKEAYYKYDCPINGRQYDFTEVAVHLDPDSRQFSLNAGGFDDNNLLTGYYVSGLTHVMTLVAR